MLKCEVLIYWSEADQSILVEMPELPTCAADGATTAETPQNVDGVARE